MTDDNTNRFVHGQIRGSDQPPIEVNYPLNNRMDPAIENGSNPSSSIDIYTEQMDILFQIGTGTGNS